MLKIKLEIAAKVFILANATRERKSLIEEVENNKKACAEFKQEMKRYAFLREGKNYRITKESYERRIKGMNERIIQIKKLTRLMESLERKLVVLQNKLDRAEYELNR